MTPSAHDLMQDKSIAIRRNNEPQIHRFEFAICIGNDCGGSERDAR